jgi:hypothetical protein
MCADEWRSLSKSSSFSLVGKTRGCSTSCASAVADMNRARSMMDDFDFDDALIVENAENAVGMEVEVDTAALVA